MLLEANFPLNFTKLWILLLVNLVVVSRMISSNTQVAGLNVPLYLLNPLTQHLVKTWAQTVNTHKKHRVSATSEIILKVMFWDANTKKHQLFSTENLAQYQSSSAKLYWQQMEPSAPRGIY